MSRSSKWVGLTRGGERSGAGFRSTPLIYDFQRPRLPPNYHAPAEGVPAGPALGVCAALLGASPLEVVALVAAQHAAGKIPDTIFGGRLARRGHCIRSVWIVTCGKAHAGRRLIHGKMR